MVEERANSCGELEAVFGIGAGEIALDGGHFGFSLCEADARTKASNDVGGTITARHGEHGGSEEAIGKNAPEAGRFALIGKVEAGGHDADDGPGFVTDGDVFSDDAGI